MTGSTTEPRILVVGNNSGAMHGSLVMNRFLVQALEGCGCTVEVIDRAFSIRNTEIGKFRPYKLGKAASMACRSIALRAGRRFDAGFYLPASLPPALTFDYYFLPLVRGLARTWTGYSHMVRYRSICQGSDGFHARHVRSFWSSFDRCIGPSGAVARDLEDIGIAPDRVRVVPNCLPPGWSFASPAEAADRAGATPSAILFLSTVRARKGIWDLLEAYRMLPQTLGALPPVDIIGPETDVGIFEEIRSWTSACGLDGRIRVLGELGHREIEERFAAGGAVFVFPTRREEAFGLVLAEAMSKGLPVVATDIGAIPEVLDGGRSGLLVPPQDPAALSGALSRLISDAGLRQELAVRGIETSRKYSFEAFRGAVREVLEWSGVAVVR